ncbi:MAG: transglycosylase SLT domain-containing protein [Prevotella sp.]|nr:transglycosylase SLT domain-containing protein [Prevotella sp.]
MLGSCRQQKTNEMTPWGTPIEGETDTIAETFTLTDIQTNGELIMLTLSGPDTYYDYRGRGMGLHYMLCEKFAQQIGVSLRVEVCADTLDMIHRLLSNEGDVIAYPLSIDKNKVMLGDSSKTLPAKEASEILACGFGNDSLKVHWAVRASNSQLADTLNSWFKPGMLAEVKDEESFLLSTKSITRHVYSPMISRSGGVISHYDHLFQKYAQHARWDWRLLAAQCYQESTFDPKARSWAGACGLMQIMPATASHLGLPISQIYEPEPNIAAAAKYIKELTSHFSDIGDRNERCLFVLAAYNGGFFHIRDAMSLAQKNGRNPHSWADVSEFVLKLSSPQFYRDPVVKHGYMRGTETVGYVDNIRRRYAQYRGFARPVHVPGISGSPHPAKRKNKYII